MALPTMSLVLSGTMGPTSIAFSRKPPTRRAAFQVRAQSRDPNEAQRPLDDGEFARYFNVDGRAPYLEEDWRLVRAQLVASERSPAEPGVGLNMRVRPQEKWAHAIAHPERGCLLLARHNNLGIFNFSVVLVTEHDDADGTSGLILNAPTHLRMDGLGLEEEIASAFGASPLYVGGPMNRNLLHLVHGRGDAEGAMRIVNGVYAGGINGAADLIRRGRARPDEFRLLAGYAGWGPGQLAAEIQLGAWFCVSASTNLIMDFVKEPTPFLVQKSNSFSSEMRTKCWEKVYKAANLRF